VKVFWGQLRLYWRRFGVLLVVLYFSSTSLSGQTLREILAEAQATFSAGDFAASEGLFERISSEFGREPEVDNPQFRRTVLPIHGYAALLAGNAGRASELLNAFVAEFPNDRERMTFVLFTLARAYNESGNPAQAVETYQAFVARAPGRPEAALATLEASRLLFELNRAEEAFTSLQQIYDNGQEGILQTQARLLALQQALALGQTERARDYMLKSQWRVESMPEMAVLAFAALDMGQQLLAAREYADAVRCFRLVPPRARLIALQRQRLESTRTLFEARREQVGFYQGGAFWTQFYTRLIGRLEGQLRGLEQGEDYTTALYLSLGQAYLLDGRPREAWILFERLARDPNLSSEEQAQAHYRWILAAIEVGVWEDAFAIAEGFGRRFPESPLVPESLYLLSRAHQQSGQYREAIRVLSSLLDNYPEHPLMPRWRFVRGFNHNLLNEPVEARADFAALIRGYPSHALVVDARLWHALTFFAERDYATTLEELGQLLPDVRGGRLEPEVTYRIAATRYAERDFERALEGINGFLQHFPNDNRAGEARVLKGDILMGMGQLAEARRQFAAVDPSAGHLFAYAIFQAGKILRAVAGSLDDPSESERRDRLLLEHIDHFRHYVDRDDVPNKTRVSEALYWIGWTHLERDDPDAAVTTFEDALLRFGDDLEAEDVASIVDGLQRIDRMASPRGRVERELAFNEWIEAERQTALAEDRLTYFARLNLYLDRRMVAANEGERPSSVLFETVERVPIERLDAEGLGRIAAELADYYPNLATEYLRALEDDHPDSMHRVYGYYARARLLMHEGDYLEARSLLARFLNESPLHPLAVEVTLHYAETLTATLRFEEAQGLLEDLLRRRDARGRPHARALLGLSRNAEAADDIRPAIAYAQRVYTVYRAFPDLLVQAYWLNAQQFEAIGDLRAAYNTLRELLADPRLRSFDEAQLAEVRLSELETRLESLDEPDAAEAVEAGEAEVAL
jgi:TolA-binding protein